MMDTELCDSPGSPAATACLRQGSGRPAQAAGHAAAIMAPPDRRTQRSGKAFDTARAVRYVHIEAVDLGVRPVKVVRAARHAG